MAKFRIGGTMPATRCACPKAGLPVQFSPTARPGGTSGCRGHQPSEHYIHLRLSSLHGSHESHRHPREGVPLLCPQTGR